MIKRLKSRSPYVGYAFVAIVVSLVCNFSYLLLLVANQSDAGQRRNARIRDNRTIIEVCGKLSISGDGFGYIITESGDSIYIDRQKVHWLNLQENDSLRIEASEQKYIEAEHLIMRRVLERNGEDFDYGALYRGSEQWHVVLYQFIFYFILAFVLLLIMNAKGRDATWQQFMLRSTICALITFATYFISPVPLMHSGEVIPVYKSRQLVEFVVVLKSCFMLAVVILYSRIYTLIYREQQISLENEMLRNENLTTKYNMLASQINPHFLFNSLSSLSMLVREKDEERALKYIDQLSYTFRYLSQNGSNSTFVALREEIQFAEAYSYLFKIRYADKIVFDFDIEEQYLDYKLPPISLQPLIGNAVKHNTISSKQLFRVRIYTKDGYLIVSNEKRPMLEPNPGTGVGLSNLNSRYQLLLNQEIEIIDNNKEFTVCLPLEKPNE
ncbi:MAG: termination factor Rho [Rikenellaceae bacterium]|nr:termination factor Rho [Rikenellaceae bacterium]